MELHELKPPKGAKKDIKRLGRGCASGQGKTAGRGHKGARARSGHRSKVGYEGGQMPLQRRLPKHGFTNIFRKEYLEVNLHSLELKFAAGEEVTPELLKERGLISSAKKPVKILGKGKLTKKLVVKAHQFSKAAEQAIKSAGGAAEVL